MSIESRLARAERILREREQALLAEQTMIQRVVSDEELLEEILRVCRDESDPRRDAVEALLAQTMPGIMSSGEV
jgi:hypothetical protein